MKQTTKIDADFKRFLQTFRFFTRAVNMVEKMEGAVTNKMRSAADSMSDRYQTAQATAEALEAELKQMATAHPEWFAGKSIKTAHGTLSKKAVTALEVANERLTIYMILFMFAKHPAITELAEKSADMPSMLDSLAERLFGEARAFLNVEVSLNKEALERLPEGQLAALGIQRVQTEPMTVKPLSVDLGKAVAAVAKKQQEAPAPAAVEAQ